MAVLHMEEQFRWSRDVRNTQWDRYWRVVNLEQLQTIVKLSFSTYSSKTKLAGSIVPKLTARENE